MRALSLVSVDDSGQTGTCTMAEALADLAVKVARDEPLVCVVIWERPGGEILLSALPGSSAVAKGLVGAAYATLNPE